MKKLILEAEDDKDIDDIRRMKVRVPVPDEHNEGNFCNVDVPIISHEVRAMIDNMLFMGAYGHKSMFESNRTRPAFRAAFAAYSLKIAIDEVDDFFESWLEYRSRIPADKLAAHLAESADGVIDLDALMGGDGDDDAPLFPPKGAPAAAAAPGQAPAPAPAAAAAAAEDHSD